MTAGRPLSGVVLSPPDSVDCNIFELPAGTTVHRIHDQRFSATSFNPGYGSSRFAPFTIGGSVVPTAYAATSIEAAIFETIFHDIDPSAPIKSVRSSLIKTLHYSILEVGRTLRLAALFSADLMKLGIERNQLIDTARATYDQTQAWTPIIHETAQVPEGMIWVSRRYDQDMALMLFGSRVAEGDLIPVSTLRVSTDPHCMNVIGGLAHRAGILIAR